MKKVLFASTALVATAGVAAAEVAVSGKAEMGIFGGTGIETQFFQDLDVTFGMSGTTDNGLSFGASIDLDESWQGTNGAAPNGALANNADDGGASIFVSGDFGTLTMGDTDGALDWAMTEAGNVGNPGSINDDETSHAGYLGAYLDGSYDGQIVRYDNTYGDFGFAVSIEADDTAPVRNVGYAVGVKYNLDLGGTTLNLGVGHQQATLAAGETSQTGISVGTKMAAGISAGVTYTMMNDIGGAAGVDGKHIGVGVGYSAGAVSLHANYGQYDPDNAGKTSGYGLAAGYDLGGGLKLLAGYGKNEPAAGASTDMYSFGASMSF